MYVRGLCIPVAVVLISLLAISNASAYWTINFGGSGNDSGNAIIHAINGEYVIAGETENDSPQAYLVKTKSNGKKMWERNSADLETKSHMPP